jgi:hypothetical protein
MLDSADAGNGTKKESRYAILVQFALSVLATGAIGYLGTLNMSTLPGWASGAGVMAVSGAIAWLTAYKTKNNRSPV